MTDAEITASARQAEELSRQVASETNVSERVRRTWASFAAKRLLEIVEELDRRIDRD